MKKIYFVNKTVVNSKNYSYLSGFKGKHFGKKPKLTTIELLTDKQCNKKLIKDYLTKIYPSNNQPISKGSDDKLSVYLKNLQNNQRKSLQVESKLLKKSKVIPKDILVNALINLILDNTNISPTGKEQIRKKTKEINSKINVKDIPNNYYFDLIANSLPNHFINNSSINSLISTKHKKKFFIRKK